MSIAPPVLGKGRGGSGAPPGSCRTLLIVSLGPPGGSSPGGSVLRKGGYLPFVRGVAPRVNLLGFARISPKEPPGGAWRSIQTAVQPQLTRDGAAGLQSRGILKITRSPMWSTL